MTATAGTLDGPALSFDGQAGEFDRRAGLPAAAAEAVARMVAELAAGGADAALGEPAGGGLLLELGAGTGEIGVPLAARLAAGGMGYVGIDLSLAMLAAFRRRASGAGAAGAARPGTFAAADADRRWPLAAGRLRAVFLSRAAHLLDPEHLLDEAARTAAPGGAVLILGRVAREPESLRAALRGELLRRLAERGIAGRRGGEASRRLAARAAERGGNPLPRREAAVWRVTERPADALAAWRTTPGLAGVAVAPALRREVLAQVAAWAVERWGGLDAARDATERYELTAVRLGASRREDA